MHLALEASSHGIECIIIDPHGHFQLLPKRQNIRIEYANNSDQIVAVLRQVYDEAFSHTIAPGEPKLKKLVIVDEISAHKFNMRRIQPILNSCFSELRKFGYGFVIICTYATDQRGITPAVRENAETYFVFRKKTLNELERIATLRHPNMKLIPYLKEGLFLLYSEDFYPEPFFVQVPTVDSLLSRREVRAVGADDADDDDGGAGDNDSDDGDDDDSEHDSGDDSGDGGDDSDGASVLHQDSGKTVRCKKCGYEWQPKRKPEEIRQCPRCNTRKWND